MCYKNEIYIPNRMKNIKLGSNEYSFVNQVFEMGSILT